MKSSQKKDLFANDLTFSNQNNTELGDVDGTGLSKRA